MIILDTHDDSSKIKAVHLLRKRMRTFAIVTVSFTRLLCTKYILTKSLQSVIKTSLLSLFLTINLK